MHMTSNCRTRNSGSKHKTQTQSHGDGLKFSCRHHCLKLATKAPASLSSLVLTWCPTLALENLRSRSMLSHATNTKKPRSKQLFKYGDSVDWWNRAKLGFNGLGQSNWCRQPPNLRDAACGMTGIPKRRPLEGEHWDQKQAMGHFEMTYWVCGQVLSEQCQVLKGFLFRSNFFQTLIIPNKRVEIWEITQFSGIKCIYWNGEWKTFTQIWLESPKKIANEYLF